MLGDPVRLLLTAGHRSGHTPAKALADGFHADFVIADKGYDSDTFVETLKGGGTPVIPPRSHRKIPRDCDKDICKGAQPGGTVARSVRKLKQYRRIAARYERWTLNYMTMLSLVSILIWLK
jgi:putative transposase